MKIEEYSMRIKNYTLNLPTSEKRMADKKFSMELYALLLAESNHSQGEDKRYLSIDDVNFGMWAKMLHISYVTVRKQFEYLVENQIIEHWKSNSKLEYFLIPTKYQDGHRILPDFFVKALIDLEHKNLLKVYLLYLNHTNAYGSCSLVQEQILRNIGLSFFGNNLQSLRDINDRLEELGLIEIERRSIRYGRKFKTVLNIKATDYKKTDLFLESKKCIEE